MERRPQRPGKRRNSNSNQGKTLRQQVADRAKHLYYEKGVSPFAKAQSQAWKELNG